MNALEKDMSAPMPDPATILVVIPTLNEERHIGQTLQTLLEGLGSATTIVVADGGSTDDTCGIVTKISGQHENVKLMANPERLQSAGINRAVVELSGPEHRILVRMDAHSIYPSDYVVAVAQSLISSGAQSVVTVMDSVGDSCFQRGAAWAMESQLGSGGSAHRGGAVSDWVDHGHHAGFLLDTFRTVGGYDTSFVANEDAELDHRIGLAGGRIWLDASIRLKYFMRPTLGRLGLQYWRYGKGRAQTVLKHRMRPRLRQMIPPAVVLVNLLALLLAPLAPWVLMAPFFYLLVLLGVGARTMLEKRGPCALWVPPALLTMHVCWGAGFIWQILRGKK